MKDAARQTPAAALDEAYIFRELPELGVARPQAPSQPPRRVPPPVEPRGADQTGQALPPSFSRQDDVAGDLEMFVHRFARDEQVHDLRRALEDQIDPEVAHDALDRYRRLAARPQRIGRLVAAAAADLHRVVDDAPAGLGVVELRDRRLEPDVVAAALGHRAA